MYKEFDILRGAEFTENVDTLNNVYKIEVSCDANDGDDIHDTVIIHEDEFEQNELYMLVLSYVSKYSGRFNSSRYNYGHHIEENSSFPWLKNYLAEEDLLLFAGMCDSYCHSISGISIRYYDEDGIEFDVELPDIDDLFETGGEFESYLNKLYNEYTKSGE